MHANPVMIIYFEGVLGFSSDGNLYLRPGVAKFINNVKPHFQVVIATNFRPRE